MKNVESQELRDDGRCWGRVGSLNGEASSARRGKAETEEVWSLAGEM